MKAKAIVVVCLLAMRSALAADLTTPAEVSSQVTLLSLAVEFGEVIPESGSSLATVNVLIQSDAAWRVSILRDSCARRRGVQSFGRVTAAELNEVLVRSEQGTWSPMLRGVAIPLASGAPTENPAGALCSIEFQLTATMEMEAGTREMMLHLVLNGQRFADLPLSYTIPPAMKVVPDDRNFHIVATDPSHTLRYDFEPRVHIVTSNVPWVLEALVSDIARAPGEATSLSSDALRVASVNDQYQPLVPGGPSVAIASGSPTGRAGVPVQVHLAVVTDGRQPEGQYKTKVEFRVSKLESHFQIAGGR